MKLDYKWTGPYTVCKVINKYAYKSDLPYMIQKHNVFHISFLDRETPPSPGQAPSALQPTVVNDSGELDINRMLGSQRPYRKLHYVVQWAGHSYIRTSLELAENLGTGQELVDQFHREHPRKPRR